MTFLAEAAHDDEKEDVERDEVDDEHVAAPRRYLGESVNRVLINKGRMAQIKRIKNTMLKCH